MSFKKKLLALLPGNKWCGCNNGVEDSAKYQFRVKAQTDSGDNLLQIRERNVCSECGDSNVDVLFEMECHYDPERGIHDRKVGVDGDDVNYGFMDKDVMARMLVEMRLADSLEPHTA